MLASIAIGSNRIRLISYTLANFSQFGQDFFVCLVQLPFGFQSCSVHLRQPVESFCVTQLGVKTFLHNCLKPVC